MAKMIAMPKTALLRPRERLPHPISGPLAQSNQHAHQQLSLLDVDKPLFADFVGPPVRLSSNGGAVATMAGGGFDLPIMDNTPQALSLLLDLNRRYREVLWPEPFHATHHRLHLGDARDLRWIEDESVHLVVTSPPYWTLKKYPALDAQLGHIGDYTTFLDELEKVWCECARVLVKGGRICCVVGDICIPRRKTGRHQVMPLHADIQVRARALGLDCLTPILWHKIANGVMEAEGNGTGFYGKPYQPGAVVKNDIEYILFLRKGGAYRSATPLQKALSMLTKDEMQTWFRSFWADIRGSSTRAGHPAPFPTELASRLIRMFSFAGDTILDPFSGTGTTGIAAVQTGRNSVSVEIEPAYLNLAHSRLQAAVMEKRSVGAMTATLQTDWG